MHNYTYVVRTGYIILFQIQKSYVIHNYTQVRRTDSKYSVSTQSFVFQILNPYVSTLFRNTSNSRYTKKGADYTYVVHTQFLFQIRNAYVINKYIYVVISDSIFCVSISKSLRINDYIYGLVLK